VAISNSRLLQVSTEAVTFSYKDYRQRGRSKQRTLSTEEFARRFLQHILPGSFVRVRHYGLLANRGRQEKLLKCRRLPGLAGTQQPAQGQAQPRQQEEEGQRLCPVCGQGRMEVVEVLAAWPKGGFGQPDSS
jgi:hypothetical protein